MQAEEHGRTTASLTSVKVTTCSHAQNARPDVREAPMTRTKTPSPAIARGAAPDGPKGAAPTGDIPALPVDSAMDRAVHATLGRLAGGFSPMGLAAAWFDWSVHLAASPGRVSALMMQGAAETVRLGGIAASLAAGRGTCEPCARSLPQDKRFRAPAWQRFPFALYAETFLATERLWDAATRDVHGATRHHLDMVNFVGRQALDTVAPSNFPATNPEVVERTLSSSGRNFAAGAALALEDAAHAARHERPEGAEEYAPGRTVAITPGSVVHRTPLAEIIQYRPSTEKVRTEPVVIVPAWIMKYYILDLRPENSLVRHLVEEGFTVFVVSWRNPGPADRDVGFDDYRTQGVAAAIEAATAITGARKVHAVGYCIGGTLLSVATAAMARDGDDRLASVTLLAAQTDFEGAGELRLFVDESQLSMLDDMMAEEGVLEASRMAGTFHLLRSNDLIWSRMIRRYLMGEREPMNEVTAWSTDVTRMPARMHSEYLRRLYLDNDLAEGRFTAGGRPVRLHDVTVPIFAVGTEWDHVAPWRSVWRIHDLVDAEVTFALTNGGHNQGILSPPGRADRRYRVATLRAGGPQRSAEEFMRDVAPADGSWWPVWFAWLGARSGPFLAPPAVGSAERGYPPIADAPGTYVFG